MEPFFFAAGFFVVASVERFGYLTDSPRRRVLFSCGEGGAGAREGVNSAHELGNLAEP
jgi:hypothetical protein